MYERFEAATRRPTGGDLVEARMLARVTVDQAAGLCGLHRTAYRRQEVGQSRVSLAVYRLLRILAGALPWDAWAGWSVGGDKLYSPDDPYHGYTAADLRRAHWVVQHAGLVRALDAGLVIPMEERRNDLDEASRCVSADSGGGGGGMGPRRAHG